MNLDMAAYYNEFDPKAAAWLRELIKDGLIPEGEVDERDIRSVDAADLRGFAQCHFFAGIGGWPYALRLAGLGDDFECWTGSCPCQPFSSAGKRKGEADERHLWPEFRRLIAECRPPVVFGEQVASGDGRKWLAGVRADLEALGYAVGAADLCAAGTGEEAEGWVRRGDSHSWERIIVSAPHIRQRLYWLADAGPPPARGHSGRGQSDAASEWLPVGRGPETSTEPERCGSTRRLADAGPGGRGQQSAQSRAARGWGGGHVDGGCGTGGLGNADRDGLGRYAGAASGAEGGGERGGQVDGDGGVEPGRPGATGRLGDASGDGREQGAAGPPRAEPDAGGASSGFWSVFDLIPCRDGKARRIPARGTQRGVQWMADGLSADLGGMWTPSDGIHPLTREKVEGRVGLLRGFGNAINPYVAVAFITAFMESRA